MTCCLLPNHRLILILNMQQELPANSNLHISLPGAWQDQDEPFPVTAEAPWPDEPGHRAKPALPYTG